MNKTIGRKNNLMNFIYKIMDDVDSYSNQIYASGNN